MNGVLSPGSMPKEQDPETAKRRAEAGGGEGEWDGCTHTTNQLSAAGGTRFLEQEFSHCSLLLCVTGRRALLVMFLTGELAESRLPQSTGSNSLLYKPF